MTGIALPKRFPLMDIHTGVPQPVAESVDTLRPGQPVLDVKNLVTRFDVKSGLLRRVSARVHAVEDLSFSLQPGETLSLVGESGCGKSTTGRTILRLTEATSGDVLITGQDIRRADRAHLAEIRSQAQMIFQDPFESLNPRMRIGQAIAEPMISLGLHDAASAKIRVAQLLEQVGLQSNMATRFPHQFSGGQRQRICIARALALEPKLIIADEAVSALDVSVKAQVINLMLDLQQQLGLAYLFISHDMAVVERISHRVAVMYLGEIVEIGSRADIFENPQHVYTRKLLAAVPVPDPTIRRKRAVVPEELASPLRPATYQPPVRHYREVSGGHFVQIL
jgi:peptide/nickel transport system ATP-binding protein